MIRNATASWQARPTVKGGSTWSARPTVVGGSSWSARPTASTIHGASATWN